MSIRLLEFKIEDGKDMFLVEYPGKGQRWVPSFMIGGQYKDEKAALRFRYDQKQSGVDISVSNTVDVSTGADPLGNAPTSSGLQFHSVISLALESRELLKCICQQQHATASEETIACSECGKKSHTRCVRGEGMSALELQEWQCPFCRLLHMDPFNPGTEMLMFTATPRNMLAPSSQEGSLSMRFNVLPATLKEWVSQKMSVSVRCVGLGNPSQNIPKGPLWPREVTASVNAYKDVFKIHPGKYGHVRREVPSKEISDLVRPNSNSITLVYKTDPVSVPSVGNMSNIPQPPRFLFAVIVSAPKSKVDILSMIKRPSLDECKQRDLALVVHAQKLFDSLQTQDLVIQTRSDFDILQTRCALSLCEMTTPVRGIDCEHIQCYDADAYVDVNIRTRNVEKRWRCPVCSKLVRPEDLIVDAFVLEGMELAKQQSLNIDPDDEDESGGFLKRLKLNTIGGLWEQVPDEAAEGEGSDDGEDFDRPKRQRTTDQTVANGSGHNEKVSMEIVLDD